jgi:hypothetical protein
VNARLEEEEYREIGRRTGKYQISGYKYQISTTFKNSNQFYRLNIWDLSS